MTFVAKEESVIASLSREKAHELENRFYQMRDELMKVRISLIDGTANEFDFFRYHVQSKSPEVKQIIRAKFRAALRKFMKKLKSDEPI
jgi:hypothetical protein